MRAAPARIRALYDRANRRNNPVSSATPVGRLIHVLGSGNQSLVSPGGAGAEARAIAESKFCNAASRTAGYADIGMMALKLSAAVSIAAESYAMARFPSAAPSEK